MSDQPTSRQALYERIRRSSKEEVILEEMVRLGFWPAAQTIADDPADEIRRRGQLEAELRALRTEASRLHDIEAMKREARKRRMAESRKRREETKQRRLAEREARKQAWAGKQAANIGYLGKGVSGGLGQAESDVAKLQALYLPVLSNAEELARAMELTVGELRFLAFNRKASKVSHYVQFTVPKRSGGERLISAPMPRLKAAQHWVLEHLLDPLSTHHAAHGFVRGRSIVSNAEPHVGSDVVVNLDLEDFFPTVHYRRVKGLFRSFGYSEQIATICGLICTEPRTAEVELDGERYHVHAGERVLPQGAPTSPAITNLLCRALDSRLSRISEKLGFVYTRYADDLSFSGGRDADVGKLLRQVRHVVGQEGFVVHEGKTRVFRRGRRQEVTGVVVNERCTLDRRTLKRFRATLYQIERDGPEGKHWGPNHNVIAAVEGFANYVAMVDPEKGAPLQARARALVKQHGKGPQRQNKPRQPERETSAVTPDAPAEAPEQEAPGNPDAPGEKKPWWKFW